MEEARRGRSRIGWRERPVAIFVLVTFLVSYGIGVPWLMLVGSLGFDPLVTLYLGRLAVVMGPTCGALAAVAAGQGRAGWAPFLRQRLRLLPFALAVAVVAPLLTLAMAMAAYAAAGSSLDGLIAAIVQAWPLLLGHFLLQWLIIGMGEEIGWRGCLLPKLAERHGMVRATLITGAVWYVWHLPVLLGGAAAALWFAVAISGFATVLTLVWQRSGGSAVPAAIVHGSVNASITFFDGVLPGADDQAAWQVVCGLLAGIAVVALILAVAMRKVQEAREGGSHRSTGSGR
jgi:membrane protease YdiL (CAAX protease family)